jgi:serine-type D-Ala-D-Ala carboxypeptidase
MKWARELSARKLTNDLFPKTLRVLDEAIEDQAFSGASFAFWEQNSPNDYWVSSRGALSYDSNSQLVTEKTLFDIASLTKVYATASLVGLFVERGFLSWDTPVKAFFSEYPSSEIQIHHLLTHTAGLPAWNAFHEKIENHFQGTPLWKVPFALKQQRMRHHVLNQAPERPPGETTLYSDLTFMTLAFICEEIGQAPFDELVKRHLWGALGLEDSFFFRVNRPVRMKNSKEIAATEISEWRGGLLQGQVHDDNCWAMGGVGGHAGVFATARDLIHFGERILNGFFSFEVTQKFFQPLKLGFGLDGAEQLRTFGWDVPSGATSSLGSYFSRRSIGHLGYTGTSLWIDPDLRMVVVLLTNRVHPTRENWKIKEVRPKIHDALWEDWHSKN